MYDPDLTLASYLGSVVNVFDNDFRDYWNLDGDEPPDGLSQEAWEGLRFWDTLAVRLLKSARTLQSTVPDENWDLSELIAIADEKGINLKNKFVRDRIELEIAWEFETYLPKMVDNALWLLDHLVAINNKRTQEYLLRVSDCFIRGLFAETIVMCGAALEAAVEGFAPDEKVVQWLISIGRADRRRKFAYLGERLEYLEHGVELISPNLARNAYKVARARTDVVHLNIDSVPDAREVIKQLTSVLRQLESLPQEESGPDNCG